MRDIKYIKQMLSQVAEGLKVENVEVNKLILNKEEVIVLKEYIEQLEAKANKYDSLVKNIKEILIKSEEKEKSNAYRYDELYSDLFNTIELLEGE